MNQYLAADGHHRQSGYLSGKSSKNRQPIFPNGKASVVEAVPPEMAGGNIRNVKAEHC